jgi:hypothetical protein
MLLSFGRSCPSIMQNRRSWKPPIPRGRNVPISLICLRRRSARSGRMTRHSENAAARRARNGITPQNAHGTGDSGYSYSSRDADLVEDARGRPAP